MGKLNYVFAIILLALLNQGCTDSCLYGGCEPGIYLTIKKELPDTTILIGGNLELNLKEYLQLGESNPGGKFAGYPDIEPSRIDTSIAKFTYDHCSDRYGERFIINGISSGITKVEIDVSWDGGREIAKRVISFTLMVNSNQYQAF